MSTAESVAAGYLRATVEAVELAAGGALLAAVGAETTTGAVAAAYAGDAAVCAATAADYTARAVAQSGDLTVHDAADLVARAFIADDTAREAAHRALTALP